MDADAALDRLAEGVRTVRKFNHPRILDAVTIEGVGTCSDALNRGAADLAREYDSLFVLHKSTSEAEVELELRPLGRHGAHRRRGRPPAQAADLARRSRTA
jgi:cytosine/adenosine deaminase-related metal-dependent hydrolase